MKSTASGSLGGRVLRLTLVDDQELDGARWLGALVLVTMDRSARNVDGFPCLEDSWLLAPDREGDLALDDCLPLIAAVRVERIAGAVGKMELHLQPHIARWVVLKRRGEKARRKGRASRRSRRLGERGRCYRSRRRNNGRHQYGIAHLNPLVVVAVDVPGSSHLLPSDTRMPRLQVIRQTSRRLGDDFKAARDSKYVQLVVLEALKCMPMCEPFGKVDMAEYVAQNALISIRRHRAHPAPSVRANGA